MYELRVEALQRLLAANGIACVALMPGANLRYFTGLRTQLSERPTVGFFPQNGVVHMLLPELEAPAAQQHLPEGAKIFTYRDEDKTYHVRVWDATEGGLLYDVTGTAPYRLAVNDAPIVLGDLPMKSRHFDGVLDEMVVFKEFD